MSKFNESQSAEALNSAIRIVVCTNVKNGEVVFAKVARNNDELNKIFEYVNILADKNDSELIEKSANQFGIQDADGEFLNVQVVESVVG